MVPTLLVFRLTPKSDIDFTIVLQSKQVNVFFSIGVT